MYELLITLAQPNVHVSNCSSCPAGSQWTSRFYRLPGQQIHTFGLFDCHCCYSPIYIQQVHSSVNDVYHSDEPVNIQRCLEAFTKEEQLAEDELYFCSKCNQHRMATKKLEIWRLPRVLVSPLDLNLIFNCPVDCRQSLILTIIAQCKCIDIVGISFSFQVHACQSSNTDDRVFMFQH